MRLAMVADKGKSLELRWMWLPTFIGQNYGLMSELKAAWKKKYPDGYIMESEERAEATAHWFVIRWLQEKLNIKGLDQYLMAIDYVKET